MSFSKSSLSLEEVIRHFETWRSNRPTARSRIPEELWKEAALLCESYPITHVSRSLRLNSHSLNQKRSRFQSSIRFVEVELNASSSFSSNPIQMELERPDGMKLRLNEVSEPGFHHVVDRFLTGGLHASDWDWQ